MPTSRRCAFRPTATTRRAALSAGTKATSSPCATPAATVSASTTCAPTSTAQIFDGIDQHIERLPLPGLRFAVNQLQLERVCAPTTLPPLIGGARFIIITHPNMLAAANTLKAHKDALGIQTMVVSTQTISGGISATASATQIRNWLSNHWNTSIVRPKWVLLMGDAEFVPTHYDQLNSWDTARNAGDIWYGQFPARRHRQHRAAVRHRPLPCGHAGPGQHHGQQGDCVRELPAARCHRRPGFLQPPHLRQLLRRQWQHRPALVRRDLGNRAQPRRGAGLQACSASTAPATPPTPPAGVAAAPCRRHCASRASPGMATPPTSPTPSTPAPRCSSTAATAGGRAGATPNFTTANLGAISVNRQPLPGGLQRELRQRHLRQRNR